MHRPWSVDLEDVVIGDTDPGSNDDLREKRGYNYHSRGAYGGGRFGTPSYYNGDNTHFDAGTTPAVAGLKGAARTANLFTANRVAAAASVASHAAYKTASLKRAKAAHISKATLAAQAIAFDESSLARKTRAAVDGAENTYSNAVTLIHDLRTAISDAEIVAVNAWKSFQAAKAIEASQRAMAYKAKHAASKLGKKKALSFSELKAAQATAAHAQAAATKAFALAKGKGAGYYGIRGY